MMKRFIFFLFVVMTILGVLVTQSWRAQMQVGGENLSANGCVKCHSGIVRPVPLSNRYFEWYSSKHRVNNVGCERCHGGDATTDDQKKAHRSMQAEGTGGQSRVHWNNLPETCQSCHQEVVRAFTQSRHYQQLKSTGLGPSCTSCHSHMASNIVRVPAQTANLCAFCHSSVNGMLPINLKIPGQAEAFMESLNRADVAMEWAESLLREAVNHKLNISVEQTQITRAQALLKDAKTGWHAFNPEASREKADEAFGLAVRAKDSLVKKLAL